MKFAVLAVVAFLSVGVLPTSARASEAGPALVGCYHDDSLDVINQDELLPDYTRPYPFPVPAPAPSDCDQIQPAAIDRNGNVLFGDAGVRIYTARVTSEQAVEVRVSPSGFVAILTREGTLLKYSQTTGLQVWFETGASSIASFKMARDGSLIAVTADGDLVVEEVLNKKLTGRGVKTFTTDDVAQLFAAKNGRVVALMKSGRIIDQNGVLYDRTTDGARKVKMAADGTVVWMTEDGRVRSTKKNDIYERTTDRAVSFKVSPTGKVALVTISGKLWRDGKNLDVGVAQIVEYKIYPGGAVAARDDEDHTYFFDADR